MLSFIERLFAGLGDEWRALALSGPHVHAGMRTTLSTVLALMLALSLHLDNPWWAAITGLVIGQSDVAATVARSFDRVLGTIIGAAVGYLGAGLIEHHILFELTCATAAAFAIYGQERAEHGYAYLLGGATVVLVMFGSLNAPGTALELAVYRSLEIFVGIAAACLIDYILAARPAGAPGASSAKPGFWSRPADRELAAMAISGGLAVAVIPLIWESLNLPGLGQTPITVFVILTALRRDPGWKAVTRLAGCLLGGLYGLVAMRLAADAMLPWLALLMLGLFVCAQVHHRGADGSYVGLQAGVGLIMAMVQGQAPSSDILPAIDRLIGIFGGITVIAIGQPLLEPLARWVLGLPTHRP